MKKTQNVNTGVILDNSGHSLKFTGNVGIYAIDHIRFPVHLSWNLCVYLCSFRDVASYLSKVANFSYLWRPR